jgi:hypothetical protein
MQEAIVGVFESYEMAEAAVSDLELVGIVGGQVELISDADEDARTVRSTDDLSDAGVRDVSGRMPDYIGEQEFYATHVKQGRAVLIVRPSSSKAAEDASTVLKNHGAEILDPTILKRQPEVIPPDSKAAAASGEDSHAKPAGGDPRNLGIRGQEYREPKP